MQLRNGSSENVSMEGDSDKIPSEDDVSRMNTEDSLLSSKASSETISRSGDLRCCLEKDTKWRCCTPISRIALGTLLLIWGVSTLIWTPFYISMEERLRMRPGLPPYDWWQNPPDEVYLKVYLFNITNAERFLSGEDPKLIVQEVGPIVYLEKLTHTNVTFNENGTMSYVATRTAIYMPEQNTIDLNMTMTVANLPVLGMASYFWDASFFEKLGFNMLVSSSNSNVTVETTIYNYLWNFTDPIVEVGRNIAPKLVPVNNLGILARIYEDFTDTVTVYIGTDYSHESFFLIDKYDGSENLPGHGDSCKDKVVNSTEGVAYHQFLTKESVIRYWRKTMCFVAPLYYQNETETYGVKTYKYTLLNSTYDRTYPEEDDCYKSEPVLLDGLRDVSQCFYDFPIAASFPHFLYGDPKLGNFVEGLTPNESEHGSYVLVEPMAGIPTISCARSQSNLILRKLEGFNADIERFSDLVVPMFWAEYSQVGLPWYIVAMMYFTVKILPIFQYVWSAFLLFSALYLISTGSREHAKTRTVYLVKNKVMPYEKEAFLKV